MATINYYHYRKLDRLSQIAYKLFAVAIKCFEASVELPYVKNFQAVYLAVKNDNPQFFYFNWAKVYHYTAFGSEKIVTQLCYLYSKNQTLAYFEAVNRITVNLSADSEMDTVKRVHDYLAKTVKYNYESIRKGEYLLNDHNIIGPLFEGKGVCEGISKAMQLLLRKTGIECTLIIGRSRQHLGDSNNGCHAWNLVKYGDSYRYFDVTWDLPYENTKIVGYQFYNKTREELLQTHILDDIA